MGIIRAGSVLQLFVSLIQFQCCCAGYELAKNAMKNRDTAAQAAQAAASQEFNGIGEQIATK